MSMMNTMNNKNNQLPQNRSVSIMLDPAEKESRKVRKKKRTGYIMKRTKIKLKPKVNQIQRGKK